MIFALDRVTDKVYQSMILVLLLEVKKSLLKPICAYINFRPTLAERI